MNFDIVKYIQILQLSFFTLLDKKYWIITSLHVKDPVSLGGGPEAGAGSRRTLRHPYSSVHRNHSGKLREKQMCSFFLLSQCLGRIRIHFFKARTGSGLKIQAPNPSKIELFFQYL